ncbi:hypothetical protein LOD99_8703 [Oopsacas minuta]|uniref:Uncharacterized protein n=1 Tax=Oopsacas minuta TaxID=111878 RepID=A0AAV7JGQ5_9METZ|nr:hypothetical protein LOD99_8703 [Oopsacas minuta]
MADPIEFLKQRLRSKLDTIDTAIEMYHVRVATYMQEKDKICEQGKTKIVNKISNEFCRLFLELDAKQKQMMDELNVIFQKVFEKEMIMPNGEQCEIAVNNLISCKSQVNSLLNETKRANFFQESSKIGQEIEQNLDAMMQFQLEQFEEPTNPVQLPNLDFNLNEYIKSVDYIVLQQENVNTVESADSNVSVELDIESQPVINQLRHLSPEGEKNREVTPIMQRLIDNKIELKEDEVPSSPESDLEVKVQTPKPILSEPIVPFQTLSQNRKHKFVVTHVGSPSYIYLQLLTKEFNQMIPEITKYHADIDLHPEKMEVVTSASVENGKYFFAKYEIDNCWYRALILSKQTDEAQVYFIDYGNTDKVRIENLRNIPEKFATHPQQAFIGSLHNIKPNGSDVTIITPSNTDEWTLPSLKYQWDNEVTQWVDVVLDAHRAVYGDVSQCGESNHLELEIILNTETIREVIQRKLLTLTPAQLTLLDREHVGLRELLVSGSMGLEIEDNPQRNYDTLSYTNSTSSIINISTSEQNIAEKPISEFREFGDLIGSLRSEDETGYYFPNIYQEDGSFSSMLIHIESPDLFYVHVIHIKNAIVDQIAREIAEFVANGPMFYSFIELRQPCIAIDKGDDLWYRCLVLELNPEKTKFFVFFVDFGNTAWVMQNEILPIEKRLLRFPAQAIPCRLSGIKPPKNKLLWSLEAMETFHKIGFHTILTAFMTSSISRERIHNNVVVMEECLIKVRLFNFENNNECLNDRLVELGYADLVERPHDPEDSFSSFSNSPDELNHWNPMETDFLSPNNNYTYEDDNVQVAIHGKKEANTSMICRYFNSTKGCFMGDKCKYIHTTFPERLANQIEIPSSNKVVQLPLVASFIFCNITAIQSPNIFHITCPNGCFDLTNDIVSGGENLTNILEEKYPLAESDYFQLHKEIQEFYNKQSCPTISENWENGEIGVALSEIQEWHRCRIIDPDGVKVFYLDYGYTEIIEAKYIRKIESNFIITPFQAIECTLSNVTPISEKLPKAKERFEELVTRQKFLGRVDSNLKLASVSLYFLPNGDEPMDSNMPCKCLNDILCDEGYFTRCESRNYVSNFEGKKIIISPC